MDYKFIKSILNEELNDIKESLFSIKENLEDRVIDLLNLADCVKDTIKFRFTREYVLACELHKGILTKDDVISLYMIGFPINHLGEIDFEESEEIIENLNTENKSVLYRSEPNFQYPNIFLNKKVYILLSAYFDFSYHGQDYKWGYYKGNNPIVIYKDFLNSIRSIINKYGEDKYITEDTENNIIKVRKIDICIDMSKISQ
jgi:hypothetical protein